MLKSTETRWILFSQEFEVISNWFDQHKLNFSKENIFSRQDYYLKVLESKNLGIKIREPKVAPDGSIESKLEIKILIEDFGVQKFNNNNQGVVNSWSKFSFETIKNELETKKLIESFTNNFENNTWLKINKDRLLLKYNLMGSSIVSSATIIDEGAGIELTKFLCYNEFFIQSN